MKYLIILVLTASISFAQNADSISKKRTIKNELSLETLQLINGVYQISYERYIANNFSAALSIGYKGKKGLFQLSGLDTDKIKTSDLYYTGYQIIAEGRYYLKKTSSNRLNGFYLGSYFKFSDYKSDIKGTYTNDSNTTFNLEFDAKITVASLGIMVGYKLPITKKLNIDFIIAGPGTGNYNFTLTNRKDLPESFYKDFNKALEEYSLLDVINADFRFSDVNRKSDFSVLSFRYGIALGYTF